MILESEVVSQDICLLVSSAMHGTPVGRNGTSDAIGHAAVYLASNEAAFVHGTLIDGGRTGLAVVAS